MCRPLGLRPAVLQHFCSLATATARLLGECWGWESMGDVHVHDDSEPELMV